MRLHRSRFSHCKLLFTLEKVCIFQPTVMCKAYFVPNGSWKSYTIFEYIFFACLISIRFFGFVLLDRLTFEFVLSDTFFSSSFILICLQICYIEIQFKHKPIVMYLCQPGRKSPVLSVYINIIEYIGTYVVLLSDGSMRELGESIRNG